ncbi:MAG: hypothetical protein KME01_08785 [Chroococcus sp. CMT-3BRIN-NPC107]|jgi:metal-dependent hydrolase (beta-lactamase superfamily II)|nr:hypothetical protein [Chroococcus sp. CMT-3BRIN-NPC107]
MVSQSVINVDLADVFEHPDRQGFLHSIAWGDRVDVLETTTKHLRIPTTKYEKKSDSSILPVETEAYICPTKTSGKKPEDVVIPRSESQVLKVNFVEVQQGDGAVIKSPTGKIILVGCRHHQLFARYLAAHYRGTSADNPQEIDCILITHGDADRFAGITQIEEKDGLN